MSKIQDRPLSIPKFTFKVVALTTGLLAVFRFAFPGVWALEMSLGSWLVLIIPVMLYVYDLGLTGFQWAFHRWVLHSSGMVEWVFNRPGWRWFFKILKNFHASHEWHHDETKVRSEQYGIDPGTGRMVLLVSSNYAMETPEQYESSSFPPWALLGFWGAFLPWLIVFRLLLLLLLVVHLQVPLPILIVGIVAISFAYWRYEVTHSIHHYSYEDWWKPKMEHPVYGRILRYWFIHHNYHHYMRRANMGVDNDQWDKWLWTYHHPGNLMLDQHIVTADDVAYHPPRPFVVRIDNWVNAREKNYRARLRAQRTQT